MRTPAILMLLMTLLVWAWPLTADREPAVEGAGSGQAQTARAAHAPSAAAARRPRHTTEAHAARAAGDPRAPLVEGFRRAAAAADLHSLVHHGAALLAHGEPGYAELDALLEELEGEHRALHWIWRDDIAMELLPALMRHPEDALRYGRHLEQREDLPWVLERARDAYRGGLGSLLLAQYDGRDPALLQDYVELLQERLAPAAPDHEQGQAIASLGRIPTPEANEVLLSLLASEDGRVRERAARALGQRGDPENLPALRAALEGADDEWQARGLALVIGTLEHADSVPR